MLPQRPERTHSVDVVDESDAVESLMLSLTSERMLAGREDDDDDDDDDAAVVGSEVLRRTSAHGT
jgi:hypothetical protein